MCVYAHVGVGAREISFEQAKADVLDVSSRQLYLSTSSSSNSSGLLMI